MARAVPILEQIPDDFYEAYVLARKPVVIRGAVTHWRAVGTWTPQRLKAVIGHRKVKMVAPDGNVVQFSMAQYLDLIEEPLDEVEALPYVRNQFLHSEFPELIPDIGALTWASPNWLTIEPFATTVRSVAPEWLTWCELFLSQAKTRYPIVHVDRNQTHAWCAQIYGEKRYWLWPPREHFKATPCLEQDLETLLDTEPLSGVIAAGDAVFIPANWPHTAESQSTSITTSGNFVNASNWDDFSREFCRGDLRAAIERAK